MNKVTMISSTVMALVLAATSFNAFADSTYKAAEAEAQKNAAFTTEMAVSIAEQLTGGKSAEAEFELEDGKGIYEVEIVMADGSEIEVEIDSESGEVLSQKAEDADDDKDDRDDKDDHDDNDDHDDDKD